MQSPVENNEHRQLNDNKANAVTGGEPWSLVDLLHLTNVLYMHTHTQRTFDATH